MAYPTTLDSFTTKNSGDTITEGHINDVQTAITSLETKLGITSDYATIKGLDDADGDTKITVENSADEDIIRLFLGVGGNPVEQLNLQDGKLIPTTDNDIDLGDSTYEFKNLYIDGTANIDALIADTADINGGTIDGVTLSGITIGGNWTAAGQTCADAGILTTVDINAGTIDGVTLGGAAAVAISNVSSLVASANLDIGAYTLTATRFISDIAIGTAPLTVTSTTLVSNLNSDLLDSQEGTYYIALGNATGTLPDSKLDAITTASKVNTSALTGTTYLPDSTVDTTALKTATGEVSGLGEHNLPGGTYGFYPQIKASTGGGAQWLISSSYATNAYRTNIYHNNAANYSQQRYITASGTDWFVYLQIGKLTGGIEKFFSAPDHVSYGSGGDYEKVPHPFGNIDLTKYEIVLLDKETISQLQAESTDIDEETGTKRLATLINEDYKVNLTRKEPYIPLHSGKFKRTLENGQEVVTKHMIKTIPDYISVRKLTKLTQAEKVERKRKHKLEQEKYDMVQAQKLVNKANGIIKLRKIGLSKKEITALIGE